MKKTDTMEMKKGDEKRRKEYLKDLAAAMSAKKDFNGMRYEKVAETSQEFIFISDLIGNTYFFDITGYSNESVYQMICLMEAGIRPNALVTDNDKKREIAELFI